MENWLKHRVEKRLQSLGLGPIEAASHNGADLQRDYIDNIVKGKKRSIRSEGASKLAIALEAPAEYFMFESYVIKDVGENNSGIKPQMGYEMLSLRAPIVSRENAESPQGVRMIPIVGTVQAGAWTTVEDFEFQDEHTAVVPFDDPKYRRATVYALTVQGNSCNLRYPDGAKIFVVPAAEKGVREGNFVVVRDYDITGKAETTVKQVMQTDGRIELWPRSTDPRCQTPVVLRPRDDVAQDGPQIWAVVIGAYQPAEEGGELISFQTQMIVE